MKTSSFEIYPLGVTNNFGYDLKWNYNFGEIFMPTQTRLVFYTLILGLFFSSTLATAEDLAHAERLILSSGCRACHALEGEGGNLASTFESLRGLSKETIQRELVHPSGTHGNGLIPDFSYLSDQDIQAIITFILASP
jgi:mono/diheme cytochrome c family protein